MANYRLTLGWNQSVMGVSETWYSPDVQLPDFITRATRLITARTKVLYDNQFYFGARISQWGTKRRSQLIVPPGGNLGGPDTFLGLPAAGTMASSSPTLAPDHLRSVLHYRLTFDVDRTTTRYWSGIPDAVSATEPATVQNNSAQSWWNNWQAWGKQLIADGWQIAGRDRTAANGPFAILGLVQQDAAPGYVGVCLDAAANVTVTKGQKIQLTGFRPAKGTRNWTVNGVWYVDSVNDTLIPACRTVFLRNSQNVDPAAQAFTDKSALWLYKLTLFPVQDIQWVRVGIHKRGRPFSAPRGRRLTRGSLDP